LGLNRPSLQIRYYSEPSAAPANIGVNVKFAQGYHPTSVS
jgi:hypothetical protein